MYNSSFQFISLQPISDGPQFKETALQEHVSPAPTVNKWFRANQQQKPGSRVGVNFLPSPSVEAGGRRGKGKRLDVAYPPSWIQAAARQKASKQVIL